LGQQDIDFVFMRREWGCRESGCGKQAEHKAPDVLACKFHRLEASYHSANKGCGAINNFHDNGGTAAHNRLSQKPRRQPVARS
jgi:hypothetical protein